MSSGQSSSARLEIEVDRRDAIYNRGERIQVMVRLQADELCILKGGRVALVVREVYQAAKHSQSTVDRAESGRLRLMKPRLRDRTSSNSV